MGFDWTLVQDRYHAGMKINPLAGGSPLEVAEVDDEKLSVKSRLWTASITKRELESAVELLQLGSVPNDPIGFAEALRRGQLEGENVDPGCSRLPNLAAVVLKDMGFFAT